MILFHGDLTYSGRLLEDADKRVSTAQLSAQRHQLCALVTDCSTLKHGTSKGVLGLLRLPMYRSEDMPAEPYLENLIRTGSTRMTADGMSSAIKKVSVALL